MALLSTKLFPFVTFPSFVAFINQPLQLALLAFLEPTASLHAAVSTVQVVTMLMGSAAAHRAGLAKLAMHVSWNLSYAGPGVFSKKNDIVSSSASLWLAALDQ